MNLDQGIVFGVLAAALALFVWGRWRYDLVALLALLVVAIAEIIPVEEVFTGFAHPAVVTVAVILVLSRALQNSGVVDVAIKWMSRVGNGVTPQLLSLMGAVTLFSMFMNNVGAMALFMPVAIRMARKAEIPSSLLLMPLAFGSLLGGMMTLIGTPPNIIIASFRASSSAEPFKMFDFAPVGVVIALSGVLFISLIGWRLLPTRKGQTSQEELFNIKDYISEVRVPENSSIVGSLLGELESSSSNITIVDIVRGDRQFPAPSPYETIRADDILVVEGTSEELRTLVDDSGLELVGSDAAGEYTLGSDDVSLIEAVVTPDAPIVGRTARGLNLHWRYGVNLLAVSRQGSMLGVRLGSIQFRPGDVILIQGHNDNVYEVLSNLGCLPLAERGLRIGKPRRIVLAVGIFAAAIVVGAAGLAPIQVSFAVAAVAMILLRLISLREAYQSIDWPIIVLLGAMIPVGLALESTGAAQLLADQLLNISSLTPAVVTLMIVLVGSMFLSDVINNAAAAVLMAPIAVGIAAGLDVSSDPFLMAVAIGASSAFLTPIGHQSNTLVMGPGGYKFSDYWRLGLPLEIIIVAVATPALLIFWPL